ncbi:lysine--tRNA ligase [Acinetobacter gerneri]|jgi:lysyl-tRNA synthetase class 2|uniref:Lysine--tRNA ligase n=1 Tax=Acinetobacter gerneri TaxID=202952 RepID=A0AAW8JFR2_9GAMM|nr:lysine--tRNA ligase [Acinetobacter gerneri]MCH4244645.1 lysine--tRNA ligase [Acinetobacter gerneri]MDQ9009713.1 lysine--tRNA ligase [Acinetobacter gerneri]MDQ9013685.1 lysine--tRNA ligase [Acinetobacter gerneri]MDQ9025099.1 lysine--tRNA ligase [Acinetobacter gerneri]MDQ9050862.1 lysine--tRNA ligase [Acinetobacter gerneri]
MTQHNDQSTSEQHISENDLIAQRHAKLEQIKEHAKETGTSPWPNTFKREDYAQDLQDQFENKSKEDIEAGEQVHVKVAGRVMLNRGSFIVIQDMTGRIQLYVPRKELEKDVLETIKGLDLGDIIAVEGYIGRSGKGDLYVHIEHFELLTKSLRPLPDKFHGLTDTEVKYRKRYLDLIVNEETRKTFEIRAKVISGIRNYLSNQRFMEVETPMMHVIPGGATARPFETHHNALDMPLFLRIAPELYLKRLVVGGFERVFEINRNFRNEGVSTRHNPEFTMIEFYQAYADYKDLMALTEQMLEKLAIDILGSTDVPYADEVYSFKGPFKKISMFDAILEHNPEFTPENVADREFLANFVRETLKEQVKPGFGLGKLQTIVFEETVETKLRQPTFITEYPAETSPLARRNDHNPHITDRFEFFIGGRELANGFSELNDPIDQAERFQAQVAEKDAGDDEAMHYDADFVEALEYGLPPTAGEGIGIDRLVMLFANAPSIRDVILFPHMRRKDA